MVPEEPPPLCVKTSFVLPVMFSFVPVPVVIVNLLRNVELASNTVLIALAIVTAVVELLMSTCMALPLVVALPFFKVRVKTVSSVEVKLKTASSKLAAVTLPLSPLNHGL